MSDESIMTDEVVVSANRNETSRKVAPVVVNVMNARLFESVNSTDLAKSLNYQSGLRVENNCQNCGFPQVRINGLEGPYSQILINSRPGSQCSVRCVWLGADSGEYDRACRGCPRRRVGLVWC